METLQGYVSKIRILKHLNNRPLIRFTLESQGQKINCLIASHSLNFLADVGEDMRLSVYGQFNQRKQFVVKKYTVIGKPLLFIEIEALRQQVR